MIKIKSLGANKTELFLNNGNVVFFSYETPVAAMIDGKGCVRTATKYSTTTSKHITQWLGGLDADVWSQSEINALTN
ncbi:hypothetical protein LCGC14_0653820 [marine sediment metagenome]|uniref:DUF8033 domain-containing protein n=1 Tax=marine sediment metagenome TaxID=412755 RepID=A0A0F9RFG2_9ZZZZ